MDPADDERVHRAVASSTRWWAVEHHATVDSTNDVARRALEAGAVPGLVVSADAQTAGRGRRGRRWLDTVGPEGPTVLAVTATTVPPVHGAQLLPLAAGLAVADACSAVGAAGRLKWPNDVLLDGRKAAGILVERHRLADREVVLIGCGLDLDWRGVGHDESWTSLAEFVGDGVDRARVLAGLLEALDDRLGTLEAAPGRLREDYLAVCDTVGREIRVELPDGGALDGVAHGVDAYGRLLLATGSGERALTVGDVEHVRPRGG